MNNPFTLKSLVAALVPTALLFAPLALATNPSPTIPAKSQPVQAVQVKAKTASPHPVDKDSHACFLSQLNLSKEQSKKVDSMMQEAHKQSQALKEQLHTKRHALMQYLQSPEANQDKALGMNNEINTLQRQLGELRLKTFFAIRGQLTPEQLQKLQHLQKERMAQHSPRGSQCWGHDEKPGKPASGKP